VFHSKGVMDISWALLNARTYHTVVSCGKDGVIVWRFKLKCADPQGIEYLDARSFRNDFNSVPVRCSWNFMATVIVVATSDSVISVWKRTRSGEWCIISQIKDNEKKFLA
jgi:hypothetical protein